LHVLRTHIESATFVHSGLFPKQVLVNKAEVDGTKFQEPPSSMTFFMYLGILQYLRNRSYKLTLRTAVLHVDPNYYLKQRHTVNRLGAHTRDCYHTVV